jgi:regulatory protein
VARAGSEKPEVSLRSRALRLLARREHTRVELRSRLAEHTEDAAEIDAVIADLAERGWLSDKRVVEQLTHARRARYGSQRISRELLTKGVPEDLVAAAMADLKDGDLAAALAIWRRKFRTVPGTAAERGRHVRFLQGRGFSLEVALRVLREAAQEPDAQ